MTPLLFPALIFMVLFAVSALGLVVSRELDKLREAEWDQRFLRGGWKDDCKPTEEHDASKE
jgi:hypothetical protein